MFLLYIPQIPISHTIGQGMSIIQRDTIVGVSLVQLNIIVRGLEFTADCN